MLQPHLVGRAELCQIFSLERAVWGLVEEALGGGQGGWGAASLPPSRAALGEHMRQILMPVPFYPLITFPVLLISRPCSLEPSSAVFPGWISPPSHPFYSLPLFTKSFI